jgi:hypothetical protein
MNYDLTGATGMVTSFTSKSEGSLSLSQDGTAVTIMGYDTGGAVNQLDVSNSNTPGDPNGTNGAPSAPSTYRAISQVNANGSSSITNVNLYSGDNPRAAILATNGNYYTVGNSGDKQSTALANVGAQSVTPGGNPSTNATLLGSYNVTQNGIKADTQSKDNNFRGETIYNNTLYVVKGSGSNGVDTVYQVGQSGALPTGTNNAINILPGFNTLSAKNDGKNTAASDFTHPFGLFFANSTTVYVPDEGSGIYSDITTLLANPGSKLVNGQEFAGLDKYSLVNGTWKLDYVLSLGLNIGQSYTVSGTTPGGDTGSYTVESTDGLRDITGKVNPDGTVTIYGVTSTVSTNADQGADPNKLVAITDNVDSTTGAGESFDTLKTADYGQVLRGVSFTPQAVPEPSTNAMLILALLGGAGFAWKRKNALKS